MYRQKRFFIAIALALKALATRVTTDSSVAANNSFDYVIVGGGLSGITVGNKLSGEGYSVIIIEAGPDARSNPAVYNAEDRGNLNGYCNWQYPAYDESGNQLSALVDSGMCIGGGTSINGMVWYRPTKAEIDKLEILGNYGWNWASLEPYMDAIECNIPPTAEQVAEGSTYDPDVHGYNGAVNTSFPTPLRIPEGVKLYKQTLPSVFTGLKVTSDLSNRTNVVSASTSWTIWYDPVSGENKRSSAADALLWAQDQQRNSLTVLTEHKVAKVLFNRSMTASGVQFGTNLSGAWNVYAKKEVILAAGSLATAPILERSGIGSSAVLKAAGITQLVNLPGVGANLNDQPGTGTSALVATSYQGDSGLIDGKNLFAPDISLVNVDEIWGSNAATYTNDLTSSKNLQSRAQNLVNAGAAATVDGAKLILGTAIDLIVNSRLPVAEFVGESYPTVLTTVFWPLTPLSRGHVHVKSSDPFQDPVIVPRFLSDTFDQNVAVAVSKLSRKLFQSAPISSVVANAFYDPSTIGANGTDAAYLAWYKSTSYGASHWIGSTSMLPQKYGGVVNAKLQVYGTSKLRVVDAGILPFQLTSHTMSTLYAVAQKAADLILADA